MAIPEGFVRCEVCGEYNGSTAWENLDWHVRGGFEPGHLISVTCLWGLGTVRATTSCCGRC